MTSLYFTADLRHGRVTLPDPPATLWLTLAGERSPRPAWLLTPETLARLWWKLAQLEDRWARGDYPADKLAEACALFAPLAAHARGHFTPAEVESAQAAVMARGGPAGPLPHPGDCPVTPWEARDYVYDGTTGRFRPAG